MTPALTDAVLVVGGYGAVGETVSTTLDAWFPGRVIAAGRRPDRARLPAGIRTVHLDVADPAGLDRILAQHPVRAVVLCVEPPDSAFVRTCLSRGIHIVDVSASDHHLTQVERLAPTAAANGATAVLSVGVAPGLTNMLARRVHDRLGGAERLDITVLLGAGEQHGADAVAWTVAQLARKPEVGTGPRRFALPGYGNRTAQPLGFSDQYSLRRTLGVSSVTTRFCLDSPALTALLFGLRRLGLFRATRRSAVRRVITGTLTRIHLGSTGFAIRVDGHRGDRHTAFALTGNEQSRVTALVAAHVARVALTGALPAGVHHVEQLPALADIPERLAEDVTLLPRLHQPPTHRRERPR